MMRKDEERVLRDAPAANCCRSGFHLMIEKEMVREGERSRSRDERAQHVSMRKG